MFVGGRRGFPDGKECSVLNLSAFQRDLPKMKVTWEV